MGMRERTRTLPAEQRLTGQFGDQAQCSHGQCKAKISWLSASSPGEKRGEMPSFNQVQALCLAGVASTAEGIRKAPILHVRWPLRRQSYLATERSKAWIVLVPHDEGIEQKILNALISVAPGPV
jgi:hypothetical protein